MEGTMKATGYDRAKRAPVQELKNWHETIFVVELYDYSEVETLAFCATREIAQKVAAQNAEQIGTRSRGQTGKFEMQEDGSYASVCGRLCITIKEAPVIDQIP